MYIYIHIYRSGSYAFTMRSLFRSSHTGGNRQRSQKETSTDDRLEAFHSQSLRKILHFKSTYYTEVLNPTARRYTNQEVRALTSQPPLTHHIHKAQLKLFGHIRRSHPNNIERNCCFTNSFRYRGGAVGGRRVHWTEQCNKLLWHWLFVL